MSRKHLIIGLLTIALSGILIVGCTKAPAANPYGTTGTTNTQPAAVDVTLVVDDGSGKPQTYPVASLADATPFGALQAAATANGFTVDFDPPGQYGVFVKRILDKVGDAKTFWIYSINGQEGTVAADQAALKSGDTVTWTFTSSSAN